MFDKIAGSVRDTVTAAIPPGVFAAVAYDALDFKIEKVSQSQRAIAIQTEYSDAEQVTLGKKKRFNQTGLLQVVLYEPNGKGDGNQLTYASLIASSLRSKTVVGDGFSIVFGSSSVANGIREGSHFVRILRINLRISFYPES